MTATDTPPTTAAAPVITDATELTDEIRAAAADRSEQRARALIAEGVDEDTALAQAADEAVLFARSLVQLARRGRTLLELVDAYDGNVYRLLRDLGDHLNLSLAYVDRATVEAHVERTLTSTEMGSGQRPIHRAGPRRLRRRAGHLAHGVGRGRAGQSPSPRLRLHRRRGRGMSALIDTLGDGPGQLVVPAHHGLVLPSFVSEGWTDIDFTDLFAGAGGSSIGLVAAGLNLKLAANHWKRAIETHATNFPDAEHLIADVSNYDFRRLPRTKVLWASPSCVWHSPGGGHKNEDQIRAELDASFDDYVPNEAAERSRATAFDVIRAAEVHAYKVIIVENVIEFATKWKLFNWWKSGLENLGYTVQLISVSSAHIGSEDNDPAAQWRDRFYAHCTAAGVPVPDVSPRPAAWCPNCDEAVAAVQSWRRPNLLKVGKYRQQYDYRCPNARCGYSVIEPYVRPAASIIDWHDLGTRIGDREAQGKRAPVPATMRRIQTGIDTFAAPTMLNVNHGAARSNDWDGRAYPADAAPVPARTTKTGDGLACPPMLVPVGGGWNTTASSTEQPMRTRTTRDIEGVCTPEPFITMLRNHVDATGMNEPLATLATARHHGVTVPPGAFISKHDGGLNYAAIDHMNKDVADPMPGLVARPNMSLVIPYRKGRTKTTGEPLLTQTTVESAGLATSAATAAIDINDCHFRMLKPRESARAQRIPDTYKLTGNQGEQQMQAGNPVSCNVSQWLGGITVLVLS